MIKLQRLGHVVLRVADIERSKAFYTGLLGFTVLEQDPGHGAQHTRPDRRKTRPKCVERVKWY